MIEMEMSMVSDCSVEVISVLEQQPLNSIAKVFLRCIILCKPARNGNFDTSVIGARWDMQFQVSIWNSGSYLFPTAQSH